MPLRSISSSELGRDGKVSDENYFRGQIEKSTPENSTNRNHHPLQNPQPLHQTRYAKIRLNALRNNAPKNYRDHALIGDWKGYRECHIKPDLLLIYRYEEPNLLRLARLGSHSELFR